MRTRFGNWCIWCSISETQNHQNEVILRSFLVCFLGVLLSGCSADVSSRTSQVASSSPILGGSKAFVTVATGFSLPAVGVDPSTGRGNVRIVTFRAGEIVAGEATATTETPTCTLSIGPFDSDTFGEILDSVRYPEIKFEAGQSSSLNLYSIISASDEVVNGELRGLRADYFDAELRLDVLANGHPAKLRFISCAGYGVVWKSIASAMGDKLQVTIGE